MASLITIDPAVCHGKPCIRGMRYPVEGILEWLASGMTIEDIVKLAHRIQKILCHIKNTNLKKCITPLERWQNYFK